MNMENGLKFGTSGLRGLVSELEGAAAFSFTSAFGQMLLEHDEVRAGDTVLIGKDLRASSPRIALTCCAALEQSGLVPLDCGFLPTPALAVYAKSRGHPAIMVTGSHIAGDRNGLKFYSVVGEITKRDELDIARIHASLETPDAALLSSSRRPRVTQDAITEYRRRYLEFFEPGCLRALTVAVYQHSSVARDLLTGLLNDLGARTIVLARSDEFVAVDTEALRPEDVDLVRQAASAYKFDALVSTDGDADRPLVADETGRILSGDLVGAITASALAAESIVTPVTSNSALEAIGKFGEVRRCRVGSPFVIEEMAAAAANGAKIVVGFEANGGFLLGSDLVRAGRRLGALPTRDAVLPILCCLTEMVKQKCSLSDLASGFCFKPTGSGKLTEIDSAKAVVMLNKLAADEPFRLRFFGAKDPVTEVDLRDGVRIFFKSANVIHYRLSGNAPELRCYVECGTPDQVERLLAAGLGAAQTALAAS